MYLVLQSSPREKILFASNSKEEAGKFFDLKVKHGKGWFELKEEGNRTPLHAGGELLYSPYEPSRLDLIQISTEMQEGTENETKTIIKYPDDNTFDISS